MRMTRPGTENQQQGEPPRSRRHRQDVRRSNWVKYALSDEEFTALGAAAARAGLARNAFAAEAAMTAITGANAVDDPALREALSELQRASWLLRRIGVNLNQAVAKLNATGQRSGDLLPYAKECVRRAVTVAVAAEAVRKALP